MPNRFLTKRLLVALHRDLIESFGGEHGIRDEGMLESALAQPEASFGTEPLHPTVYEQAAAYLFHLVKNHPFVDGNKRVAFAAADVFLRVNGLELEMSDSDAYKLVIAAADGSIDKEEIARQFNRSTKLRRSR